MKCPICKHGETKPGLSTVTLERDGMAVVFRGVQDHGHHSKGSIGFSGLR